MERILVETAGWGGAILIICGYALLAAGKLNGQSKAYHWLNVLGAFGFAINGWWHGALPSASLNIVWMAIGATALWRIANKGSSTSAT